MSMPMCCAQAVVWLAQELMEAEVTQAAGPATASVAPSGPRGAMAIGSGPGTPGWGRSSWPSPSSGQARTFRASWSRARAQRAGLVAVVQEAYVNGVSTRKVDRLVEALGWPGCPRINVSRLCRGLDEQVTAFRERPLEVAYPYLWLDAKVEKVRAGGRVEHRALVVAYGVDQSGQREVIGLDVGAAETEAFWREFLRSLVRPRSGRGAAGRLRRPRRASSRPSPRCSARRGSAAPCTSCVTPLGTAPRTSSSWSARRSARSSGAANLEEARRLLGETVAHLEGPVPKVARLLLEASRPTCWPSTASRPRIGPSCARTNPLERVNREIGRRTDVVGSSPTTPPCCGWPRAC